MTADTSAVLVVAPNWLGDAVMALPAIGDIRRGFPTARLVAAARPGVADLMRMSPLVDDVLTLEWRGQIWRRQPLVADAKRLQQSGVGTAILFPNSFASAYLVQQAGVPERWGYASDLRRSLLTRAVQRPARAVHQGEYYQHLVSSLGIESGPLEPELKVPVTTLEVARALLAERGWNGRTPLATLAPGAAYGRAKQWIPSHVVSLVTALVRDHGTTCVLVGSSVDAAVTDAIVQAIPAPHREQVIDLAGATSLELLAAILAVSQVCIANDSGAMHLAAAVGCPVVAIFGPTIVEATRPLARRGGRVEVLTHRVWCRPCMLRECPIDHRCMTGITPERVLATLESMR